jgi:LuxR family maltose regulon positive regulatory protein
MSQSEPALPLHRYAASGELTGVTAPELAMDSGEVGLLLRRHGVGASASTVAAVERHTAGWACGVHLCAAALRTAPDVTSALRDADAASVDFLSREFLARLSPSVRELLVRTSVAEVVHPDLARAIIGSDADIALDGCLGIRDFVDVSGDGSFRCRPVLRAAAAAELSLAPPELARRSRRHAARWFATHGDMETGVELAAAAEDWAWVAEALIESSSVPSLLAQVTRALTRRVDLAGDVEAPVALQVHLVLARLMLARLQGDPTPGGALEGEARRLLAQLPLGDLGHALSSMLDAQVGALHVSGGRFHEAVLALSRGANAPTRSAAGCAARADCAGQLALAEAFQGDLRRAVEHAEVVLADGTSSQGGVDHAQLAMAFVHLGRLELAPARQRLDAVGRAGRNDETWLRVARQLAQARLLTSESQPDAALRCLSQAGLVGEPAGRPSFMDALLAAASAEALMAAGEPRSARAVMIPHQRAVPVQAGLLAASTARELGDREGARTALGSVVAGLASAPLEQQIDGWLLEARFADEDGRFDRSRSLVERALRLAGGEMMRRPFAGVPTWLQTVVARDVALRRGHGDLLAHLLPAGSSRTGGRATQEWSGEMILEALTAREKEVLGLLAEMCSTEEIAAELFLSVNTIKTYVRGILRKLCVNRRVDAVRRGRELGLC